VSPLPPHPPEGTSEMEFTKFNVAGKTPVFSPG
jgi:hypothetical protein